MNELLVEGGITVVHQSQNPALRTFLLFWPSMQVEHLLTGLDIKQLTV
jgi:hypothetical protein